MARWWRELLAEPAFADRFPRVVFAVLDGSRSAGVHHGAAGPVAAVVPLVGGEGAVQPPGGRQALLLGHGPVEEAAPGVFGAGENPGARDPMKWKGQNLLGFALTQARDMLAGQE